jgi:hypothetical protein
MVCRNDEQYAMICWDDKTIYGFIAEPTECQKKLLNAVNKLPNVCRKVVILYAFEGMQRQKIAGVMGISLSAIRFLIHRSGQLLKQYLGGQAERGLKDGRLSMIFSDWPYVEYAKLVELRKNVDFWSKFNLV